MLRAVFASRWQVGAVAAALALTLTSPGLAAAVQGHFVGGSTIITQGGGSVEQFTGGTIAIGIGAGTSASSPSSSLPGATWPGWTGGGGAPNTPLNLSGSSEGSGSGGGGSSGGGLVWGDPLSASIGDFGKVHTSVHYFSQSGTNGAQQAVGINFSIRY